MATRITQQQIVGRIASLGPFASAAAAARALDATLRAMGDELTDRERADLARELPAELGAALERRDSPSTPAQHGLSELYQRISASVGVPLGRAIEETLLVCRALAELLPPEAIQRLQKHLPELGGLFVLPEPTSAPGRPVHASSSTPHDLAEGRPGGSHPLASSDTRTLAHRHSVARSDDPHADTRLSSSRGLSQEREEHTLATGRPGSRRPLSSSH